MQQISAWKFISAHYYACYLDGRVIACIILRSVPDKEARGRSVLPEDFVGVFPGDFKILKIDSDEMKTPI